SSEQFNAAAQSPLRNESRPSVRASLAAAITARSRARSHPQRVHAASVWLSLPQAGQFSIATLVLQVEQQVRDRLVLFFERVPVAVLDSDRAGVNEFADLVRIVLADVLLQQRLGAFAQLFGTGEQFLFVSLRFSMSVTGHGFLRGHTFRAWFADQGSDVAARFVQIEDVLALGVQGDRLGQAGDFLGRGDFQNAVQVEIEMDDDGIAFRCPAEALYQEIANKRVLLGTLALALMHLDLRGRLVVKERVNHLGFAGRQGGVTREDRHAEQTFLAITDRNRGRAEGVRRDIHQNAVPLLA